MFCLPSFALSANREIERGRRGDEIGERDRANSLHRLLLGVVVVAHVVGSSRICCRTWLP